MHETQPEKISRLPDAVTPARPSRIRRFFYQFIWLFLWPVTIGLIALLVMGGVWCLTGKESTGYGPVARGLLALYVAIIVLICAGFIQCFKNAKSLFLRASAPVLRIYMYSGVIIGTGLLIIIPDTTHDTADAGINVQQTTTTDVPPLASDPTITATLKEIGAQDIENIETKFVPSYDDPERRGEYQAFTDQSGKWVYGVLSAKQGVTGNDLKSILAHEYLHHLWFKSIDTETKEKLTSDLISLYGNDRYMQQRVQSYAKSYTLQPTELFSFYCTESTDRYLTPYVTTECNKYINRASFLMLR